jgi:hypothetical protein
MVGPVTLAAQMFGDEAALQRVAELKQTQSAIAKALCETRPDLLLFLEKAPFGKTEIGTAERRAYNALRNIARYYDVAPALWMEGYEPQHAPGLDRLGLEFLVPAPAEPEPSRFETAGLGVTVSLEENGAALAAARDVETAGRARTFFMNRGGLSPDVPIEDIQQAIRALHRVRVQ